MKRILLLMILVYGAPIVWAQSTSDFVLTPNIGGRAFTLNAISSCAETVKAFSFKDGLITVERRVDCFPSPGSLVYCENDCYSTRQWRETYGVKDGKLQLLKIITEEATRIPAQAERWEYRKEEKQSGFWCCISTQKQYDEFSKLYGWTDIVLGEGLSITEGDGSSTSVHGKPFCGAGKKCKGKK